MLPIVFVETIGSAFITFTINYIYVLHIQPFRNIKRHVLTSQSSKNTCRECNQTRDTRIKGVQRPTDEKKIRTIFQ
jgi:hypothetical protein